MKICPNCGTEISDGKMYCEFCGTTLPPQSQKTKIKAEAEDDDEATQLDCDLDKYDSANDQNIYQNGDEADINDPGTLSRPYYSDPGTRNSNASATIVSDTTYVPQTNIDESSKTQVDGFQQAPFQQPFQQQPPFQQPSFQQQQQPPYQQPQQPFMRPGSYQDQKTPFTPNGTPPYGYGQQPKKSSNTTLIIIIAALALLVAGCGIGAYLLFGGSDDDKETVENITTPVLLDQLSIPSNNETAYVVSRLNLRTQPSTDSYYSIKATLPAGTQVQILNNQGEWSYIRVLGPSYAGYEGWISTHYIISAADYAILKSIFTDAHSQDTLKESYYLYALLQYFKLKNFIGRMTDSELAAAGLGNFERTNDNQWQLQVTTVPPAPSEARMQKLVNPSSGYADLAVILRNIVTGERRVVYFTFDNQQRATLYRDISNGVSKTGRIQSVFMKPNGDLEIHFTQN